MRWNGRFVYKGNIGFREVMEEMALRGLARKSPNMGMVITGRGMILKERLEKLAEREAKS